MRVRVSPGAPQEKAQKNVALETEQWYRRKVEFEFPLTVLAYMRLTERLFTTDETNRVRLPDVPRKGLPIDYSGEKLRLNEVLT